MEPVPGKSPQADSRLLAAEHVRHHGEDSDERNQPDKTSANPPEHELHHRFASLGDLSSPLRELSGKGVFLSPY